MGRKVNLIILKPPTEISSGTIPLISSFDNSYNEHFGHPFISK